MSTEQVALEAAQAEIERLKSTVTEQAVSPHDGPVYTLTGD